MQHAIRTESGEDPSPVREWTTDAATWRLREDRRHLSREEKQTLEPEFNRLWQLFGHLSRRWQNLIQDPRINHPQLHVLNHSGAETLALSRLIYAELDAFNATSRPVVSPALIAELLQFNKQRLTLLEMQLSLLTSIRGYASDLLSILEELFHSRNMSPVRLLNLARQIIQETREEREKSPLSKAPELLTVPGVSLPDYLPEGERKSDARVCAVGVQAARITAAVIPETSPLFKKLELLTTAALLQDVGFLCLEREHLLSPQVLAAEKPELLQRHPSIGAGMVSAVQAYPVELPYLVASHHERLDQTGYPYELPKHELTPSARMTAIVSRYVELSAADSSEHPEFLSGRTSETQNPSPLWKVRRDAARGQYDPGLVNLLLEASGIRSIPLLEADSPDANPDEFTHFSRKRLRYDDSHLHHDTAEPEFTGESRNNVLQPNLRDGGWRREVSRFVEF